MPQMTFTFSSPSDVRFICLYCRYLWLCSGWGIEDCELSDFETRSAVDQWSANQSVVLEVPGSIPAADKEKFGVRTCFTDTVHHPSDQDVI